MSLEWTAIAISTFSLFMAGLSLGWNIYRDVLLKPKLRVTFQISTLFHPSVPEQTYLHISAVNHGPGRITCSMIEVRTSSLWRRLRHNVEYGVIAGDWTNPLSGQLPSAIDVGETLTLLLPYDEECFLSTDTTHLGIRDSFGRVHWVPRVQLSAARAAYIERFARNGLGAD